MFMGGVLEYDYVIKGGKDEYSERDEEVANGE